MKYFARRLTKKHICLILLTAVVFYVCGVFHHPFEKNFYTDFHYPYDGDIELYVEMLKHNQTPEVKPINSYNFHFHKVSRKCEGVKDLRVVYLVKSAPDNIDQRIAIRSTWGFERRFSDVEIRTVFLLGLSSSAHLEKLIVEESKKFNDIVQANFTDAYFNSTFKTMSGFTWIKTFCTNSKFYIFVDDDYYISTKNILRFLRYPTNYPRYLKEPVANLGKATWNRKPSQVLDLELQDDIRLYSGFAFSSAPLRHLMSKWYVSLQEYPYHMWPPYVTAGALVLSKAAFIDMFYASYYTKHFKFDDIYIGLLAYKTKIEPFHCEEFYFYKKTYNKLNYKYVIASHGYGNPHELVNVWSEQKSLGNA